VASKVSRQVLAANVGTEGLIVFEQDGIEHQDMSPPGRQQWSFNHLVGERQQLVGNGQAERLGGL
jgi:hypothetical protein